MRNNDMQIVVYRAVGCMMMMISNNLKYEYAANSATTLYAVINMAMEIDNEHMHT